MNVRNQTLLARFSKYAEHPKAADLTKAAEKCLTVAENFSKHRELLERDGFFTPEGKRAKLTEALTKTFVRDLRDARGPIDAAVKDIERLHGTIKPVQVDRTDDVA